MIDQSTIDRIMDAANIVDVVSEYVTLRRSGTSYKGLCPFHDDKTPSFYVSPSKGVCKCFSCGKGGNAVHFIMEQEQMSYYEALKFLAKKYGIEVEERQLTPAQRQSQSERESLFAVNEWASKYFHETMLNTADGRTVGLAYFRSRGFRDDIIDKFRLGFSLSQYDAMAKEAIRKGYKDEFLLKTGLCYRRDDGSLRDKYWGRVIFPWFSVSGKIVAFGGRVLDSRTKGVNQKYINSPESEIFHKSNELYGIYQAKKSIVKEDRVYMVEGYTDVISMHQCGVENVVANSGTALNEAQIRLLHRFTSNITLLYDGDGAGIHAALRGTDMLLSEGMNVKILLLPDGDDPDSFARKHTADEYRKYIESNQTDFIIFKTNLLLGDAGRDPLKRAQLIKDIVRSISVIPEEIIRSTYIHECSEILGIDELMLVRETEKNRAQEKERIWKEKERERNRLQNKASVLPQTQTTPVTSSENAENTSVSPKKENTIGDITASTSGEVPPANNLPEEESNQTSADNEQIFVQEKANTELVSRQHREEKRFMGLERMIMSLVVKYGEQTIDSEDENGVHIQVTIADYVNSELQKDELKFRSPIYSSMLTDAVEGVRNPDFIASRYFLNNQNMDISTEAVELLSEPYQLSKGQTMPTEQELLSDYIVHLMLDYKFTVIEDELRIISEQLSDSAVYADHERCKDIMQKYIVLSDIQRKLAKRLGDRIVMK
ncbi:MAG: DNA primase [Prevotellaceae bacterium]|nr:DNA primase [Prevotellaceae bacterium]